jgi:hypothetical protein
VLCNGEFKINPNTESGRLDVVMFQNNKVGNENYNFEYIYFPMLSL